MFPQFFNRFTSLILRWHIKTQKDDSGAKGALAIHQFSEILVGRQNNATFAGGAFDQRRVRRFRRQMSGLENVATATF